jgi:hypothetical protein
MSTALDFSILAALAGDKPRADVPCPMCAPASHHPKKRVLRIWHEAQGFIRFNCARCGERGHASSGEAARIDRALAMRRRRESEARTADDEAERRRKAQWLWRQSMPAIGTLAERYLAGRGITALPSVLRFLPARGGHPAAMLAAFGMPGEPEPGAYRMGAPPSAVHLTKLAPDGTKLGKIMVGVTETWPLALVPPNDLGGLSICEGIETALSARQATNLGAWAAGAAGRMPGLAPHIAGLCGIEAVTVFAEDDDAGRRGAEGLARELGRLRPDIEIRITGGRP